MNKEQNNEMPRGIRLFGPPGSGKSTFAKKLAENIGAHFIEQDDYYAQALADCGYARRLPQNMTKEDAEKFREERRKIVGPRLAELLQEAISDDGRFFVLDGAFTIFEGAEQLEHMFDGAVCVDTPLETRKQRIIERGGDDTEHIRRCTAKTTEYENGPRQCEDEWAERLSCDKHTINGDATTSEMVQEIMNKMPQLQEMMLAKQKNAGGKDGTE